MNECYGCDNDKRSVCKEHAVPADKVSGLETVESLLKQWAKAETSEVIELCSSIVLFNDTHGARGVVGLAGAVDLILFCYGARWPPVLQHFFQLQLVGVSSGSSSGPQDLHRSDFCSSPSALSIVICDITPENGQAHRPSERHRRHEFC